MGASSRLRTFQFVDKLADSGVDLQIHSFFNEVYLRQLYAGEMPNPLNVVLCYLNRIRILFKASKFHVIWVEKEIFPFLPAWAEKLIKKALDVKLIVDYDDAVFHNYDLHKNSLVRKWLGNKIADVMRAADVILAGSPYLEAYAVQAGAKKVVALPTVIYLPKYEQQYPLKPKKQPVIGWIGSPSTLIYVKALISVFEQIFLQIPFTLMIVNGKERLDYKGDALYLDWSEETEVEAIQQMDIGIMPLPNNDWEKGKCAYKLIQYMACKLPVVASPVGVNQEVVQHGENGYLAATDLEWEHYLSTLLKDAQKRQEMGEKGKTIVENRYTLDRNLDIIKSVLFQ
jgi:glycosyltransferase involved in cell wall biosynthesis